MEKKARAASMSGFYLVVVAAVVIVTNLLAYGFNKRIDATKNERYTLSKGSANLVRKGLSENLQVTLYVTRGLPKTDIFVEDLVNLMKEYESASAGKLKYVVIEPKTDKERKVAKDAGLQAAAFGEGSETGDQVNISKGYMGIVFEYGSEKEVIPILSPDNANGLEFWVTNKIRLLRDKVEDSFPKIGVLKKDGIKISDANLVPAGRGPGPNIKALLGQHFPFYKFEDVDLEDGAKAIDGELRGVLLMQADKEWSDKELARIDEFMMLGDKSLMVMSGAVNMKSSDATMKAELNLRGLDKLLSGYGIEMKKEAVLDWGALMRIPVPNQLGRIEWQLIPGVLQLQHQDGLGEKEQMLDNSFIGFFRMDELAVPFASTLVQHPEKQPKAKFKTVLRSTPNSTVATETINMKPSSNWKPAGKFGQRDLAIEVQGVLKSAYAGKKAPEGITLAKESKSPSRVLVIASGQFLANPFARSGNPPPLPPQMAMMGSFGGDKYLQQIARPYAMQYMTNTILAFKNLLDWMSNDTDLIAASAKLMGEPNLSYADISKPKVDMSKDDEKAVAAKFEGYKQQRKAVQQKVQWSLTLLPSLFFMLFGMLRWRRREATRDDISLD
jgi:ABC-type uncharacterized transport system involved in gliding motility auxiliary subunit